MNPSLAEANDAIILSDGGVKCSLIVAESTCATSRGFSLFITCRNNLTLNSSQKWSVDVLLNQTARMILDRKSFAYM